MALEIAFRAIGVHSIACLMSTREADEVECVVVGGGGDRKRR
jgi:hypothetical protein